jgi:hypothetical protein
LVPYYIRTATANKPGAPEVMVKSSSRTAIGQGNTPMVALCWCEKVRKIRSKIDCDPEKN